jgi:hypothetical protein
MNSEEKFLIDTDVFVDFLRGYPQALVFMQQLPLPFGISAMTVAELFAGVREGKERAVLERSLGSSTTAIEIDTEIATLGGLYRRDYGKSHGTGLVDAVIAATAKLHGRKLVTLNRKHFPMLDNILIPYQKN